MPRRGSPEKRAARWRGASASLEGGRPSFLERAQALAQIVRRLALADAFANPGDVGLGLGELLDGALHVAHGKRCETCKLGRDLVDLAGEVGALDQPVEVAHGQEVGVAE